MSTRRPGPYPEDQGPCKAISATIGVAAAFRLRTVTQAKACDYPHRQSFVDMRVINS
jgi:hypothetical protein